MLETDILVIGSGISGLSYAIKMSELMKNVKIIIVTKNTPIETNTKYAQGGLAVVIDLLKDSYKKHIQDTLIAGDGLCDKKVVETVINEGPLRLKELIHWGVKFDKNQKGKFNLIKEGGHSENRIVHHKDITGFEIEQVLLNSIYNKKNINILSNHYVIDLITNKNLEKEEKNDLNTCIGAYVLNKKKIITIKSKITLLATGGAGHVYKNTTNPMIATGDGIALAFRSGAQIKNMQFFQFHPTAFYNNINGQLFLISEAIRGFGAKLRLMNGSLFMKKYDKREELASRDVITRAINHELKISGDKYVGLDCTNLDKKKFLNHFPNIYYFCKNKGLDLFKEYIPVVPAAHYMCGGIKTDLNGLTTIQNLFAIGECSYTGLHGSNRLASNSLLEAIVFAHRGAIQTKNLLINNKFNTKLVSENYNKLNSKNNFDLDNKLFISNIKTDLQFLMSDLVGIIRNNRGLLIASEKKKTIYKSMKKLRDLYFLCPEIEELRNLLEVSDLIIKQSIKQKENRGTFYNSDFNI